MSVHNHILIIGSVMDFSSQKQGGSGLGLALCQRIAAAHGSALRIESEPGRGTRVSVTLPVWKEDAP